MAVPKADEALFVATYLAGRWSTLVVVTVEPIESDPRCSARHEYLAMHGYAT
jgi:hypothetical protein